MLGIRAKSTASCIKISIIYIKTILKLDNQKIVQVYEVVKRAAEGIFFDKDCQHTKPNGMLSS